MLKRRHLLQSLLIGPASLNALTGCWFERELRIATHPWIGYETLYLAEELQQLPSNIRLLKFNNTDEKITPLRQGQVDGATLTLDEAITFNNMGIPLTIVAILDISSGADVVLVRQLDKDQPIKPNQRIGYETNYVGELMLELLLNKVNLSRQQMRLFPIHIGENQAEAWQRHLVDVLISFEPYASQLKHLGAKVAFTSRDFPQRIFDVLVIRNDRLNEQQNNIKTLLQAHFAMVKHLQQQTDDGLYRIATRQHISYSESKQALHGIILPSVAQNQQLLNPTNGQLQQAITLLQQLVSRHTSQPYLPQPLSYTAHYLPGESP